MEAITKQSIIDNLKVYSNSPDDDIIRFKIAIKNKLLHNVDLLYALNDKDLETELFNPDGTLNIEVDKDGKPILDEDGNIIPLGEWGRYFGHRIRPSLFIPETQTESGNFLCYTVGFTEIARYNEVMYYPAVEFTILIDKTDVIEQYTNIARHDLISAILIDEFDWANVFGCQCNLISNRESITDANSVTRSLIFQSTTPRNLLKTVVNKDDKGNKYNSTSVINNVVRR